MSEAELSIKITLANDTFSQALKTSAAAFNTAMADLSRSAGVAGAEINQAFKLLGVQSLSSVANEIRALESAYELLARSGEVSAQELDAAHKSMSQGVAKLKAELLSSGKAIDDAFGTLGIRSIKAIEEEIKQVGIALGNLKKSGASMAEIARATDAATARVKALKAEAGELPPAFTKAEIAAKGVADAFGSLGIRSGASIKAEINKVNAAFATLKNSDLGFSDKDRAAAALIAKLKSLNGELSATGSEMKAIHPAAQKAASGMQAASDSSKTLSSSLAHAGHIMAELYVAWAAMNAAFRVSKDILLAGIGLDKINAQLIFATGSAKGAADALAFVRSEADRLGIDVAAAGEGFAKFSASVRGTSLEGEKVREVFSGVADAARVMQLSADETKGIFLALSQMMAKGKVQAEEFRGQLGDRLPIASSVAAQALGVTTAEFSRMLDAGELVSETFLPKFAAALKKNVSGALPQAVNTMDAQLNRLKSAWTLAMQEIAKSGAMDEVIKIATQLSAKIAELSKTGELQKFGKEFAQAVKTAGEGFIALTNFVTEHADAIKKLLLLYVELRAVSFAGQLAGMATGLATVGASAATAAAGVTTLGSKMASLPLRLIPIISLAVLNYEIWKTVYDQIVEIATAEQRYINIALQVKGKEDLAAATAQLAKTREDLKRVGEYTNATRAQISGVIREFRESVTGMATEGKTQAEATATAISNAFKGVDLFDGEKLREIAEKFNIIKMAGLASADELKAGWKGLGTELEKLSAQDLLKFQTTAVAAMKSAQAGAEQLAGVLEASLGAAFKLLGGDLEKFRTGMDKVTQDAIKAFQVVAENATASSKEIGEAFSLALKTADTKQEVAALGDALKKAASDGVIAGKDLEDAQSRLQAAVNKTAGEIDGALGDAFKRAGVKSKKELGAIAAQAKKDFEAIRDSGDATGEGVDKAKEAWEEADKAAQGTAESSKEVANETDKAAAAAEGQNEEAQQVNVTINNMAESAKATTNALGDLWSAAVDAWVAIGFSAEEASVQAKNYTESLQASINSHRGAAAGGLDAFAVLFSGLEYARKVAEGIMESYKTQTAAAVASTQALQAAAQAVSRGFQEATNSIADMALGMSEVQHSAGRAAATSSDPALKAALQAQGEAAHALAEAYRSVERSARQAAKSAGDAARGFISSTRGIHEELLLAQGKDEQAAQSRMASRKAELKIQYAQLQLQLLIAEAQARAAGIEAPGIAQAKSDAASAYAQAVKDLDSLAVLESAKRKEQHKEELARIAAEKVARKNQEAEAERNAKAAIADAASQKSQSAARQIAQQTINENNSRQTNNNSSSTVNNSVNITGFVGSKDELVRTVASGINQIQGRSR
jgi:tape measure domain-containing protein